MLPGVSAFAKGSRCVVSVVRTATRFPVVFKAPEWLFGAHIETIEGWTYNGKSWTKIPLQIDEVNDEGSYVLEQGIPYTKFTDDGLLDAQDEMSVRGLDLGQAKINKSTSNPPGQFTGLRRVDFCDDEGGFFGSLWIGAKVSPTNPSPFEEIFNRQLAEVNTPSYRYQFRSGQPMLMGSVAIKTPSGERPVFSGNAFVMPLRPRFFFLPSMYFGESDFTSEIECWRSGPVRTIVAVGSRFRKLFSIFDLHLFSELVFYKDYFQIPTKIEFVFDPSTYLASGSGISYVLQYPDGVDWMLNSNLKLLPSGGAEQGVLKESAYEASSDGVFSVRGESEIGSFVAKVRVDPKALKQSPPPYLVSKAMFERKDMVESWPWLKKTRGSLGVFIDISGVKRGVYDFALDLALSYQAHDDFTDFKTLTANWSDSASF